MVKGVKLNAYFKMENVNRYVMGRKRNRMLLPIYLFSVLDTFVK